jgi:hypothetical protein
MALDTLAKPLQMILEKSMAIQKLETAHHVRLKEK